MDKILWIIFACLANQEFLIPNMHPNKQIHACLIFNLGWREASFSHLFRGFASVAGWLGKRQELSWNSRVVGDYWQGSALGEELFLGEELSYSRMKMGWLFLSWTKRESSCQLNISKLLNHIEREHWWQTIFEERFSFLFN